MSEQPSCSTWARQAVPRTRQREAAARVVAIMTLTELTTAKSSNGRATALSVRRTNEPVAVIKLSRNLPGICRADKPVLMTCRVRECHPKGEDRANMPEEVIET